MVVVLLTFAIAPALSAPRPATPPPTDIWAAGSDYYERHPELKVPGVDLAGDFYLRHPNWSSIVQIAGILLTGALEASDYFERHPELGYPELRSQ